MSDLRELAERLLKRDHSPGAVVLVESWPEIQRLAYGVLSLLSALGAAEWERDEWKYEAKSLKPPSVTQVVIDHSGEILEELREIRRLLERPQEEKS